MTERSLPSLEIHFLPAVVSPRSRFDVVSRLLLPRLALILSLEFDQHSQVLVL